MGILFSRFRKKKSATEALEKLEKLENKIKETEEYRSYVQTRHRKLTKLIFVNSVGLCLICGIILYFQFTSTWKGKLLYLTPLALSPLILFVINKIISWYYVQVINKNHSELIEMKKEKKKILDEVMDKETYKVAKEILDKYSAENVHKPSLQIAPLPNSAEGLKKRTVQPLSVTYGQGSTSTSMTPKRPIPLFGPPQCNQVASSVDFQRFPPKMMPAPILSRQRNYVDKVVDYLIGDGPNNRYALICSRCHSHNGMALKEEFEYISYKCCYCNFYNPARKVKPMAPKLMDQTEVINSSDSESTSKEEEDERPKNGLNDIEQINDTANEVETETERPTTNDSR